MLTCACTTYLWLRGRPRGKQTPSSSWRVLLLVVVEQLIRVAAAAASVESRQRTRARTASLLSSNLPRSLFLFTAHSIPGRHVCSRSRWRNPNHPISAHVHHTDTGHSSSSIRGLIYRALLTRSVARPSAAAALVAASATAAARQRNPIRARKDLA